MSNTNNTARRRGETKAALLTGLALFVGMVLPSAIAKATPTDDVVFLKVLDDQGITYTSASKIITAGHAVCEYRSLGYSESDTVGVVMDVTELHRYDAGFFVGASEAAYCPEYSGPVGGGTLA